MKRTVLKANSGMILTDGNIYGKTIYLEVGKSADAFYEITEEDYRKMLEEESEELI